MALFGSKKKKEETKADKAAVSTTATKTDLAHVLRHARITEKSTMHQQSGIYVFDVSEAASKRDILAAVKKLFSVTPVKIRVAAVPSKVRRSMRTGKVGVKKGGKKAYIYLKEGDAINM